MADGFNREILHVVGHRPWPMPVRPWVMTQTWTGLLFAHWPMDIDAVRSKVPSVFELDLFDGHAWLAVVPFYMSNVGPRAVPTLPWVSAFAELNVRYLRPRGRQAGRVLLQPGCREPLCGEDRATAPEPSVPSPRR